jgi:hypothetical protein
VATFVEGLAAAWEVVVAGTGDCIRLPPGGPASDNAVVVVFESPSPAVVVVPEGVELVRRAGAMPIGPDAVAVLNALSKQRKRVPFGLKPTPFQRGPVAALKTGRIEQHARLEFFDNAQKDLGRIFGPETAVLRHIDTLLGHCGITVVARDELAIVVQALGPLLGICPAAIAAIHRGGLDPESTYRIAKVDAGWRIPISIVEAGLVARVAAAFRPGIDVLHDRYDGNGDLAKPFRANPRRPTTLAEVTSLPKCVVRWFLELPKGGLKNQERMTFAGFANATNRAKEVYELATQLRPDLRAQLKEAMGWKMTRRTCSDVLLFPSKYAAMGLVCDCESEEDSSGEPKRRATEDAEEQPAKRLSSDVFTPGLPTETPFFK